MRSIRIIRASSTLAPANPKRIYICDLSSGVYVSTDGGGHWALMNEGLLNRAVICLSLSADGKVLYAGTYGAGVYRMEISMILEGL